MRVTLTSATAERPCAVSAATGSEVTCVMTALQAGRYSVAVTVADAGAEGGEEGGGGGGGGWARGRVLVYGRVFDLAWRS